MLFRKFRNTNGTDRIHNKPTYPRCQDSCRNHRKKRSEAYPASREIRKSINSFSLPGSLTLEAALVLPAVMMFLTAVMSLFTMMMTELLIRHAMEETADNMAGCAYAAVSMDGSGLETLAREVSGELLLELGSAQKIRSRILGEAGDGLKENTLIEGGVDGISFAGTGFDAESQELTLCVSYRMQVPFFSLFGACFPVSQQAVRRVWTGKETEGNTSEQIVYITETGTVYHTSLSCSHLKLKITSLPLTLAESRRNADGSRYGACELCGDEEGDTVYITSYGDCYHKNRNCSGLKRTIKSIPLSQVGSRGLCRTCQRRNGQ